MSLDNAIGASTLARRIEEAERAFAVELANKGQIALEDAEKVSVFYRRRYLANINDRQTAIEVNDARLLTKHYIHEALSVVREQEKRS